MARTYRLTMGRRLGNRLIRAMLWLGVAPGKTYLLSVRGRKSGQRRSTPVNLVEEDARRWLVAPYGEVAWVRNARAAGQVTLSRGRRTETVRVVEVGPAESAPVLKQYLARNAITRPYFDSTPESSLAAFEAEAPRHPVFRIAALTPQPPLPPEGEGERAHAHARQPRRDSITASAVPPLPIMGEGGRGVRAVQNAAKIPYPARIAYFGPKKALAEGVTNPKMSVYC